MKNPFKYSLDNKRYYTWNYFLKNKFNNKVYKVPLTLATTCPNRDGSKGTGGCSFCLAGGGGAKYIPGNLYTQFIEAAKPLELKWPNSFNMPYFQSYSNTYVNITDLKLALDEAVSLPKSVGICIATRPDCLPDDVVSLLSELSKKTFLIVELGLQTYHEKTSQLLNRGHSWQEFLDGYNQLSAKGIPVCVHIINGLPGETPAMMLETAKQVAALNPHSVKFHMLHILNGTSLAASYAENPFPLLLADEYVNIVCDQIELLPQTTVIQRITGDPPKKHLIAPEWTLNKLRVRNAIDKEFANRNSYQGRLYKKQG